MFELLKAIFKADIKKEVQAPIREGFVAVRLIRHMSANGIFHITRCADGKLDLIAHDLAMGLVDDFENMVLDAPLLGHTNLRHMLDLLIPTSDMSVSLAEGVISADGNVLHEFHREISINRVVMEWTTTSWSHYGYLDITDYMNGLSSEEARAFLTSPNVSIFETVDKWMQRARETHEKFGAPFNFHGRIMGADLWLSRHKDIES